MYQDTFEKGFLSLSFLLANSHKCKHTHTHTHTHKHIHTITQTYTLTHGRWFSTSPQLANTE